MMEYHGGRLGLRLEGESHSTEMQVTISGLPAGERLNAETLRTLLARRRPGQSALTTARQEPDEPEILSGVKDGILTGEPVTIRFANRDMRPADYEAVKTVPPTRPCRLYPVFTDRSDPRRGRGAGRGA